MGGLHVWIGVRQRREIGIILQNNMVPESMPMPRLVRVQDPFNKVLAKADWKRVDRPATETRRVFAKSVVRVCT